MRHVFFEYGLPLRGNIGVPYQAGVLQEFLTVPETADLLRTTSKAIYTLIERGQLAGVVRVGRRVLVKRAVLDRALDESGSGVASRR